MYESKALKEFEDGLAAQARNHIRRQAARAQSPERNVSEPPGILVQLEKQLRRERMKARSGHAGYDFNRHLALLQMVKRLSATGETVFRPGPQTEKAGG